MYILRRNGLPIGEKMKTLITILVIMFCINANAQECKFQGGTFELKSKLLTATCPAVPFETSSDITIADGKCGSKFGSITHTTKDGCMIRIEVLTMFEEKGISGISIVDKTCPTKERLNQCYIVYKFLLIPKITVKKEESKGPTKQEADKE